MSDQQAQAAPEEEPSPPESEKLFGSYLTLSRNQVVIHPTRDDYLDVVGKLKEAGYVMCVDLTAVDHLTNAAPRPLPPEIAPERFEVVANLINHGTKERIRVRVQVPGDDPTVASLFQLYVGTEAMEREAFDMFGIDFDGHPDMTRILMPETWEGHPLRKDFSQGRIPVQFKGA